MPPGYEALVLEVVEALVRSTDTPTRRAAGISLCRQLVRHGIRPVYQALNQDRAEVKAAALRLLTALASQSTATARELLDAFNFGFAVGPLSHPPRLRRSSLTLARPPDRMHARVAWRTDAAPATQQPHCCSGPGHDCANAVRCPYVVCLLQDTSLSRPDAHSYFLAAIRHRRPWTVPAVHHDVARMRRRGRQARRPRRHGLCQRHVQRPQRGCPIGASLPLPFVWAESCGPALPDRRALFRWAFPLACRRVQLVEAVLDAIAKHVVNDAGMARAAKLGTLNTNVLQHVRRAAARLSPVACSPSLADHAWWRSHPTS